MDVVEGKLDCKIEVNKMQKKWCSINIVNGALLINPALVLHKGAYSSSWLASLQDNLRKKGYETGFKYGPTLLFQSEGRGA